MNVFRNFKDPVYKDWRKKVYTRDNHQCQWPGCNQKKRLNAHHIKSWAQYPGLRFDVNNGITLCRLHHDQIKGMEEIYAGTLLRLLDSKKHDNK